ncbi:plasmid replication, integration and excision activator [Myceligenerans pegani]|uniref:Plasmid replication, integration and excision activator n=1 Tax=Myceligenerans pegani TaxID=2776917 RepID=A0ABR9N2H6_9MICO|nr:plasmid replication, integration and excision activator [Myceligenerans sp. TRM 65318]MBE1877850.1 plasmid replication, integration and excision activator [Myceligenerans sp. TRM 65318]MBE3020121.1 plasmid replication, integration and excision activator [Myceligenerans sp. TRM 65318]
MAMQRRFAVEHSMVFPAGAQMKGGVEPVSDFNAPAREDGSRPQQIDKDTGLPLWQVVVSDMDEDANKRDTGVAVKIAATHQPVPPAAMDVEVPGLGTVQVRFIEFIGLTAMPYVDDNGTRPRIAWSFKAVGLCAPGKAAEAEADLVKGGAFDTTAAA